jgi:hypothetical protein
MLWTPVEIKSKIEKKGEHIPTFKDKLMTMRWKQKNLSYENHT